MHAYGDQVRRIEPRARLAELTEAISGLSGLAGVARHDALTGVFINACELAQGLADAEFAALGYDDDTEAQAAAMALLLDLARGIDSSWRSGFREAPALSANRIRALGALPLPDHVACRIAEGHAFYALYPEAYLDVAARYPWSRPPLVIGLRSIGAGLAALASVAARASQTVTLRPCGAPFAREVRVSNRLRACLTAHDGPFAIADEGPGLSGSSFAAAAGLLRELGVEDERIVLLPSHRGPPGPQASADARARWSAARKATCTLDDLLARDPIGSWFADLTGPLVHVEDLSGGAWRRSMGKPWPPASPGTERRKFRLTAADGVYLARFAGLGDAGAAKLRRARALHGAGFAPEPIALRRGFLLERWVGDRPLHLAPRTRAQFLARLGDYLAFRARAFPADRPGADLGELRVMAVANARELGGEALALATTDRLADLARLQPHLRPVEVDGRLHAWEWRATDAGAVKTDAIDHSCGHDLVGCQDIAWDVAGALVEFDLSEAEVVGLCGRLEARHVRPPHRRTLEAFTLLYAGFQAGLWSLAVSDSDDGAAAGAQRDRYHQRLRRHAEAAHA